MTSVAIIIVKFDVITGFSKPAKPDIISMNHQFRNKQGGHKTLWSLIED
jgi:hypothetical protein